MREMEDWKKELKRLLMKYNAPVKVSDYRRLIGVYEEDEPEVYAEIAHIAKSLESSPDVLVVKQGRCSSCFSSIKFTGKKIMTCPICKGYVTEPEVYIKPRR